MTRAEHSAASAEWYTPADIVERARRVLGGIDLDPASCALAQETVRADDWCGRAHPDPMRRDGLAMLHALRAGHVFLNPPTPPRVWWAALVAAECRAVYVSYSIEALSQSQGWTPGRSMLAWSVCVPARRVRYMRSAPGGGVVPGPSPTHASAIVGVRVSHAAFAREFASLGVCVAGELAR